MNAQRASGAGLFGRLASARQIGVLTPHPGHLTREMLPVYSDAITAFLDGRPIDVVNGVGP